MSKVPLYTALERAWRQNKVAEVNTSRKGRDIPAPVMNKFGTKRPKKYFSTVNLVNFCETREGGNAFKTPPGWSRVSLGSYRVTSLIETAVA